MGETKVRESVLPPKNPTEFPEYSRDAFRGLRLTVTIAHLLCAAIFVVVLIGHREISLHKWLYLLSLVGVPLILNLLFERNRTTRFTAYGIIPPKGGVYPWDRVTWLQRLPGSLWKVSTPHERLNVYIGSETLHAAGFRGMLRNAWYRMGHGRSRMFSFTNTPEVIEQMLSAMEKYSGRDLRALIR